MRTLLFVMLGLSSLTGSASTPNLKEFVYIADVIGIWEPDQYQLNKNHPGKAKQFLKGNQDILAGLQIKDSHLNTMDKYRKTGKPRLFMFLILDKEIHLVHALEENEKNIQKVKRLIEIGRLENSWDTLEIDAQIKKADVIITGDITYVKQKFPRTYYVNAKAEHKGWTYPDEKE